MSDVYIVRERQSEDSELWVQCDHMSIYKIELDPELLIDRQ